jgi:hypothetical protein
MKWFLFVATAALSFGQQPGTITGMVVDGSGASVAHAQVDLSLEGRAPGQETESAGDGQFTFSNVAPGPYHLSLAAKGFATKPLAGELQPGESLSLPPTALTVASLVSNIDVTQTQTEIAEEQIKLQEKQRLVGFVPNYFVNYLPDAAPLSTKQKFELSWKTFFDPSAFIITGITAGVEQARDIHKGFGLGAQGYGQRYAADYGGFVTDVIISGTILPALFKQDPRYFYKGTGTRHARFFYAINRSLICQGDNRHAQFCYSSFVGRFAAGALSNLYYPASDRNSAGVVFENAVIGIGGDALGNLFQEFIARRLTPKKP